MLSTVQVEQERYEVNKKYTTGGIFYCPVFRLTRVNFKLSEGDFIDSLVIGLPGFQCLVRIKI